MRIGLLRETKLPGDNRVALDPLQVAMMRRQYPELDIRVQSSKDRAFTDEEYRQEGIPVEEDLSACDMLLGIKEAAVDSLIPGKHYVFFGHIAKRQVYNRPLLRAMMDRKITFSDYEYMVDEGGGRVCAFGWWAGIVGVYYTLRGYGLRTGSYSLPAADASFTVAKIKSLLKAITLPKVKMVLTGRGRVARGAKYILNEIGAAVVSVEEYLNGDAVDRFTCTFAYIDQLVRRKEGGEAVDVTDFHAHPERYESDFLRFARTSDILVCCHYWNPGDPVYLAPEDYRDPLFRIRMIGDITCDIRGSVCSTLRASTHADPFYDYNPETESEEPAFSSDSNISVMAVDTCPNALPRETSHYFGEMLLEHVIRSVAEGRPSAVLDRATLLKEGRLTPKFSYLEDFAREG